MNPVLMYTTGYCPYCSRAEMLLKQRGVAEIEKSALMSIPTNAPS